ncbi:phosphoribosyl pyrophosphate synthase-associated protein 2-like isoform X1 [Branchiostoma floridae]|uniref:Phosphoribosyl pyrophosphate synthase-associated protein 2-like isoform X1 n=1 Tax=Branchiostoma floridae TaxID=7739 RepID=A0A9J7M5T5_BRAFL|nr:phosphoribosyl pyrophosphate synthase-associated protein 2-like isoform X1 [Branchiostoma floridae]
MPRNPSHAMNIASKTGLLLFTGNSHPDLARLVASRLGLELAPCSVRNDENAETKVDIDCSVRGQDVFIIQTGSKEVNTSIMELLIMMYACKTSCAESIVAVIPYLPYSKQSKMRKRGSIPAKLLASLLCKAGMTHLITMDLHAKEIQGFFDVPVDNLRASPFLLQYIQEQIPDYRNAVIVAKNPGSARRAQSLAERLRLGLAVIHGETKEAESDAIDGRHSPPPVVAQNTGLEWPNSPGSSPCARDGGRYWSADFGIGVPMLTAKEKPPINVVGDVGGRIAIIVDDIIDDVETFVACASMLKDRGAYKIYAMATHGLLSSDAPRLLEESTIDEIVVTNSVSHEVQKLQCHKIKTVDISVLISEAIRHFQHKHCQEEHQDEEECEEEEEGHLVNKWLQVPQMAGLRRIRKITVNDEPLSDAEDDR